MGNIFKNVFGELWIGYLYLSWPHTEFFLSRIPPDAGKSTIGGQIMWVVDFYTVLTEVVGFSIPCFWKPCFLPILHRYLTGMVDKRTLEKYEKEAKEKNRETW